VRQFHTYKAKTKMISRDYFAKIYVQDVFQQRLGEMTCKDANEEGYDSIDSYRHAWERIFKRKWDPSLVVYVIKFKVVE
jgi:hypothetical protein